MTEINAKIIIQDDIADILNISDVELDGQIESWVERNLNLDDEISDWMGQYFDIDEYLRHVSFEDYYEFDAESQAVSLLESYSPLSDCNTARAFTESILRAIRYLLLNNDNVEYFVKAIDRFNRNQMKKDIREELKDEMMNQLREEVRDDVYAKCLEDFQRQLANMTEPERDSFIRNAMNTYQKPIVPIYQI